MLQGIIGKKLGMSQVFRDNGISEPVTAIEAGPCTVIQVKTTAREGYDAVQLGFIQAKRLKSPERGHLKGLGEFRFLREFRVGGTTTVKVGDKVDVNLFKPGELIDVTGVSKGKGFAGVVKRHHFAGGPKTHGQSDRHRHPGSIGSGTSPGRVWKGTRMAGRMGNDRVTVCHLEVFRADPTHNLLLVKGAVPGSRNGLLLIRKSKEKKISATTSS
ncbi:MAG: 50S ribosomal protein L3 [Dehalococcoidales bacterium]|jgi:large subunit ribosomal protein L3|nr:50S ribosomal protein L3 [Dehalococcoidales bacterium]MDP6737875.1 50S ribosomal protein L3 [Dehalococcoidales bacterium]|tara:strand:- start:3473 stop:4117 length:645 start_codon:yes stop_codon:yes gene_type:complete